MEAIEWYKVVLRKYAVFDGRARRKEFWFFTLINFLAYIVLEVVDNILGLYILAAAYSLAIFIPNIAVSVRRLHDTGRSGWWLLIGLIPIIGAIVLIIFWIQDSQVGNNQYGANPKEAGLQ